MPAKDKNEVAVLSSGKHLKKNEVLTFTVMAVFKSLCSDVIKAFYPDLEWQPMYQYDLQIKDTSEQSTKVLISPSLNSLIEFNELKCGCMINISEYFTKISEYSSPPKQIICINNISIIFTSKDYVIDPSELDYTPLCSKSPFYYPLFNHDSFIDVSQGTGGNTFWNNDPTPYYYHIDPSTDVPTISQSLKSHKKNHLPVYGKIIKKSYILYTIKQTYGEIYPFHFNLIIEDIKGNTIDTSIWSEICGKFYSILNIGDMIMINNYKTTKYNNKLELKLNPSDPSRSDIGEGKILILKNTNINNNEDDNNSLIPLPLSSIKDTLLSPDDYYINIYGIVTYISPLLRSNKGNSDNECFFHYRYIRVRDNSTSIELVCLLRSNSQYTVLNTIELSNHILLTNMHVKSSFLNEGSCFNERYCYLYSTDYSQYYIYNNDDSKSAISSIYEYDNDNITTIDMWYNIELKTVLFNDANNMLIGFSHTDLNYSLPLILHNKKVRNELFFPNNNNGVDIDNNISISSIQSIIDNLQYKESLLLPIIGHIVKLQVLNEVEGKNDKRRKIEDLKSGYIGTIVVEDVNHAFTLDIEVNSNYVVGCLPDMKYLFTQLCELYGVKEASIDSFLSISKNRYIELNVLAVCESINSRKCYLHSITQVH